MTTDKVYDALHKKASEKLSKDKLLSIKYQLDWIQKLKEQVDWANNPEVLTDFVLYLRIGMRREE